ncbi:hypothetical protein [Pedobacter soli]|uniref:YD repeat-containing protein n=1 Tax=Pedobacter soli TaxID=390242 RepID=A0A1G6ZEF1_9SPHI|nr:hypothetical protein [Pedobacter soli]SDE00852.1 hypothetical protein SAMN04488024_11073 [Pedobacter soli]
MKKNALYLILFLLSQSAFSQKVLEPSQLKGKVKSYSSYEVSPDNPKQKLRLIDSVTYDKQQNISTAFYFRRIGNKIQREKHIHKGDTLIVYSCSCSQITALDQLEKDFKIQDNKTFQNQPQRYTTRQPTQFVDYTVFDKQKRVTLTIAYSASGYKRKETKYTYNHSGKVIQEESRNGEGKLIQKITNRYDQKGNLVEINDSTLRSVNIPIPTIEKSTFQYDSKGRLMRESRYRDFVLYADYQYSIQEDKNSQSFICLDKISNTSSIDSTIYYGLNRTRLKKVKQNIEGIDEIITFDYYSDGLLKTESHFDKADNLNSKTFFTSDKHNNPYRKQVYQTVMHYNSSNVLEKTERKLSEYQIQIEYYR